MDRPAARTMAAAAKPAARPAAASRLTNWKARSAIRYSRGRTSAVRKKSNSDTWAVTPAPREERRPTEEIVAGGGVNTRTGASASRVGRDSPIAYRDA